MQKPLTVLVTGATGHQGGAVTRQLLEKGHRVRAFTRNPEGQGAQVLKQTGAEICPGNFDDRKTLEHAARNVDCIFAMGTPFEAGTRIETRQGFAIVDVAKTSGAKHLIYNSVACADRNTGIPHFDSKFKVEQYIKSSGVPYTIIGPVFFMENFLSPQFLSGLQEGKLSMALPASKKLAQIAVSDIASFVVMVAENPKQFYGHRIDIASDDLTGTQTAQILSKLCGRKIEYVEVPLAQLKAVSEDLALMFKWFERVGYSIDTAALRKNYPKVTWHTLEDWAKNHDWGAVKRSSKKAA